MAQLSLSTLNSRTGRKMGAIDRTKQELNWYAGGIYFCTHFLNGGRLAGEIEKECKRRKIFFKTILVKDRCEGLGDADEDRTWSIQKVTIPEGPETTALEKKQLADWVINRIHAKPGIKPYYKTVWIQRSCDVNVTDVDCESGIETHWVNFYN